MRAPSGSKPPISSSSKRPGARSAVGRLGGLAARQLPCRAGPGARDSPAPAASVLPSSFQSSRTARSRATRASIISRGNWSSTPRAGSTSTRWSTSRARTSRRRSSRSAKPGRSRSCSALRSSRSFDALPTGSSQRAASREKARRWHATLAEGNKTDQQMARLLKEGRGPDGRLSAAFVVELLQWLRDQPLTAAPAWHALQRALQEQDDSAEELLRVEHQREAADQLAIGNRHHEHAAALLDRLDALLRTRQRRGASASAGSVWRVRAHGLRDARSIPAFGRAAGANGRAARDVGRHARGRAERRRLARRSRTGPSAPRRLLPDLPRAVPARARDRVPSRRCANGWPALPSSIPPLGYLGLIG